MKKFIILVFMLIQASFVFSQNEIVGTWLNEEKDAKVEIYKSSNKYFGRIIWLSKPTDKNNNPVKDTKNPNSKLRDQPILGLVIINNLVYDKNEWNSGTVYDPESGKTYKCSIEINNANKLKLIGHWGIFSDTQIWTRTTK